MNANKTPIFKNGFFWSIVFLLASLPATSISDSLVIVCLFIAIILFVSTLIKRIKRKKTTKQAESAQPQPQKPKYTTESIKVAGTSFYQDAIESLGTPNDDYSTPKKVFIETFGEGEKVFEYDFNPDIELIPEPTNEHDKNAIRVEADDELIGYVPRDKTAYVRGLMEADKLYYIGAEIEGGKYKTLIDDEIESDRMDYYARLILKIKSDS